MFSFFASHVLIHIQVDFPNVEVVLYPWIEAFSFRRDSDVEKKFDRVPCPGQGSLQSQRLSSPPGFEITSYSFQAV
jgi:hypothetical protein